MPRIKEFDISGKISNASEIEGVSYSFKSKGRVLDEGTVRPDGSFEISFESRKKKVRGIVEFQDENGAAIRNFTSKGDDYSLAAGEEDSLTVSSKKRDQELSYSFKLSDPITGRGDTDDGIVPLPRPIEPTGIIDPAPPNPLAFDDIGVLREGTIVSETISTADETDWYRIRLKDGVRYVFNQRLAEGKGDPILRLYNSKGILVNDPVISDNVGPGLLNSRLTYTAMDTGTYFLVAGGTGAGGADAVHDYNISFNSI